MQYLSRDCWVTRCYHEPSYGEKRDHTVALHANFWLWCYYHSKMLTALGLIIGYRHPALLEKSDVTYVQLKYSSLTTTWSFSQIPICHIILFDCLSMLCMYKKCSREVHEYWWYVRKYSYMVLNVPLGCFQSLNQSSEARPLLGIFAPAL